MNRREVLGAILIGGGVPFSGPFLPLAHAANRPGKLYVFVQAQGGWDVTSFCDPKTNQPDEPVINHWAERDEPRQAGNIWYAPFADNETFFDNHHDKMLVINGVDAQTNSHSTGITHNWSGRISEGYPTMSALLAGHHGAGLSVPYLSFGGFSETGGIVRYTRLDNPDLLRNIASPNLSSWTGDQFVDDSDWMSIVSYSEDSARRLVAKAGLMPMDARNRAFYEASLASADEFKAFADAIPPESQLEKPEEYDGPATSNYIHSTLRRQAQLSVLAFKTGVAVSADLWMGGFDTHANNDVEQEWLLANLTSSVDYLWEYAEKHGVADRMVVVMGSDFGRTNFYNAEDGKDHWPYGSFIVMEKNQPWTNRVVGETNELHEAYNIDPATLERASDNDPTGTHIYPKHVHKALRRYVGIEKFAAQKGFPFNNTEDFAFFA